MITSVPVNSQVSIQPRLAAGRIPRYGPMLMLVARPALILLAQGLTYLIFKLLDVENAAVSIRNWFSVYGTLTDLGCLALLLWLTRREGIRLLDLVGIVKSKLKKDIPLGFAIFIVVFPITIFLLGRLAMLIAYGSINPVFPEYTFIRTMPLLAVLYSRFLWWPLWSATEELTYNGYALPRLAAMTGKPWLAVLIVSFFYSLQHSILSLAGFQYGLYMFLLFIPLTVALELIYLKLHRLPPLIVAHWLMDMTSVWFMLQIG
jgi:hypothetical protein